LATLILSAEPQINDAGVVVPTLPHLDLAADSQTLVQGSLASFDARQSSTPFAKVGSPSDDRIDVAQFGP
jgi:hypothetical protein